MTRPRIAKINHIGFHARAIGLYTFQQGSLTIYYWLSKPRRQKRDLLCALGAHITPTELRSYLAMLAEQKTMIFGSMPHPIRMATTSFAQFGSHRQKSVLTLLVVATSGCWCGRQLIRSVQ